MINKIEQEIMSTWNSQNSPSVSICCITYNHEKFISEAIDGFLMQKTTFPFEIIIGEDDSTDNTLNIINKYRNRYPNLIQVITSDSNVGMQKNFERTFKACQSRYIALCEGDDYWTDSYKLQKQITFLENNPEYSICCHMSENYDEKSQTVISHFPKIAHETELTIFDLFNANIAHTCTFVYRNKNVKIPPFFEKLQLADWPLHMLHAEYAKIKFFPENMAKYRIHSSGVWSSSNRIKQLDASILALKYMNKYFKNKYSLQINKTISNFLLEKAHCYLDSHNIFLASRCYRYTQKYSKIGFIDKVKYIFKCYFPESYPQIALIYKKMNYLWQK